MSKLKKSTKKFAQKKLKGTVKHTKKYAHGHKRSGRGHTDKHNADNTPDTQQQEQRKPGAKTLAEMDVDEFLDGGFEQTGNVSSDEEQQPSDDLSDDSAGAGADDLGEAGGSDDLDSNGLSPGSSDEEAAAAAAAGDSDGNSSDDEDDDDEVAAASSDPRAAAVAADNVQLKGAISKHKQQLESLKTKDPEFYAYLQATDAGLLGFGEGQDDDDDDLEDLSESSSEDEQDAGNQHKTAVSKQKAAAAVVKKAVADSKHRAAAAAAADGVDEDDDGEADEQQLGDDEEQGGGGGGGVHVSSSMVDGWCQAALEKASMGAMMQLIKAYRVACHYGDTEQQMSSTLTISSGAVFNRVMLFMLKEADGIFRRMLGLQQDMSSAAAAAAGGAAGGGGGRGAGGGVLLAEHVTKAPRWRKVEPLVKSYLGNSLHLLSSMTQPAMTAYTLRRLRPSAAFLGPYPRLTKKLLKLALELFGSGEKENAPRLQALLLVRQMGLVLPPPALQTCLRGAYRAYAANAKFVSPASLPALAFMAAGVVELSALDLNVTYQVGFVAIRELAVLLRNALSQKTQDAHKEVYCWQTLNCLELWMKVLSAAAVKGSTLQPLVYPLTQLLLGAARLVPTPRYFPIRLRLVRALNRLGQSTGVYIPVSPLLLEMLQWSELKRTPTGGAGAPPDMLLLLRLSKTQLKMASLQEEVVNQVLELLADHLRQWATSVAFPEACHLPVVALRGFIKGCAVERFRRAAKQLVDAMERNVVYVGNARDNVTFAPQDLAAASRFLTDDKDVAKSPLVQFSTQLLQKAAARMTMRSSAATQEVKLGEAAAGSRGSKRRRATNEDDDDVNEEEDEESEDGQQHEQGDFGRLLAAGEASDEEVDKEELAGAAKKHIRQKEKRIKRAAAAAAGADDADGVADVGADEIAEYQLSDEDEAGGSGDEADSAQEESESDGDRAARRAAGGRGRGEAGGRGRHNQQQHWQKGKSTQHRAGGTGHKQKQQGVAGHRGGRQGRGMHQRRKQ